MSGMIPETAMLASAPNVASSANAELCQLIVDTFANRALILRGFAVQVAYDHDMSGPVATIVRNLTLQGMRG